MYKVGQSATPINPDPTYRRDSCVKNLNQSERVPLAPLDARSTRDTKGVSIAVGAGEDYSINNN
jgi:hypothetical protein